MTRPGKQADVIDVIHFRYGFYTDLHYVIKLRGLRVTVSGHASVDWSHVTVVWPRQHAFTAMRQPNELVAI